MLGQADGLAGQSTDTYPSDLLTNQGQPSACGIKASSSNTAARIEARGWMSYPGRKRMSRHGKKTCPICEGTGELTTKQAKRLKYALDLAAWAIALRKHVEAAEANRGLTPEDLQFLSDLRIGLEE